MRQKQRQKIVGLEGVFMNSTCYFEGIQSHISRPKKHLTFLNYEPSVSDYLKLAFVSLGANGANPFLQWGKK